MVYLILFEFSRAEKHYQLLLNEIKNLGKWSQPAKNAYLVSCKESASQIYFHLKKSIRDTDNLLVIQVGKDWFGFLPVEKLNWLQQMLD